MVSSCASSVVVRSRTWRGHTVGTDLGRARAEQHRAPAGRGYPGQHRLQRSQRGPVHPAPWARSHMPRMTCVNSLATRGFTMTTEAPGPIAAHSRLWRSSHPDRSAAGPGRPAADRGWAARWAPRRRRTWSGRWAAAARPRRAPPPPTKVLLPAPRTPARPVSQAATHTAARIRPGSTAGTSRRLAHGWSGTVPGRHRTLTVAQPIISSGRAQIRAVPDGSFHVMSARTTRRASSARPNTPSSRAGKPMYQITQYSVSSAYSPPAGRAAAPRPAAE